MGLVHCSSCDEEIDAQNDSAYFQGELYHPDCLGEILEAHSR